MNLNSIISFLALLVGKANKFGRIKICEGKTKNFLGISQKYSFKIFYGILKIK
jgi:hypothetical protein